MQYVVYPCDASIAMNMHVWQTCSDSNNVQKLPLYVDGVTGRTVTHGQQKQFAEAFHAALFNPKAPWGGFKAGQVIATFSPNNLLFPTILFGTMRGGGVVTTNNHTYTTDELVHQLKDSGASVLVTHPDVLETALAAAKRAGIKESRIILMEGGTGKYPTMDDVINMGKSLPLPPQWKCADPANTVAYLAYSSGTTGLAKGVKIAHSNVISNCQQIGQFAGYEHTKYGVKPLSKGEVTLGILPSYHIYALILLVHYVCKIGASTVWLSKFELPIFLETIQKYKIGVLYLVPPIIIAMAKHPLVDKYDLSSVREVFSGAAPLGGDVAAALRTRLGKHLVVRQGYGLTESSTVTHMALANTPDGSIGIAVPNVEIRLVSPETGKDADEGEIWIRSPSITLGYLNNAKATADTFVNGWLHTGDVGIVDKDGQFYIVDRIKELIKVGIFIKP